MNDPSTEPTNGGTEQAVEAPVKLVQPLVVSTFNAALVQPCQGCGGLFFIGHESIVQLLSKNPAGEQLIAGYMCKYCVAQHPEIQRQIRPLVLPGGMRFGGGRH